MIRGLYTSASGMMAEMVRNDLTANNLANVNTTGYKKDTAVFKSFPEVLLNRVNDHRPGEVSRQAGIGTLGTGAIVDEIITSHEPGQLRESSNPFDLAISGDGFFVVRNQNGTFYTRNGSFTLDGQGYLVTSQGDNVMGQAGPVQLGSSGNVVVDGAGRITVNDNQAAVLRLVTITDKAGLTKVGDSMFTGGQAAEGITGQVKQRFSEASNVNALTEMVNMITIMRAYEANQKMILAHDQTLAQAMEVGRLR